MSTGRSIQGRLAAALVAAFVLLALLTGFSIFLIARRALVREFDSALLAKTNSLSQLVENDNGKIETEFAEGAMPSFQEGETAEYFQLWLNDGRVLSKSKSLQDDELTSPAVLNTSSLIADVTLPDGRKGRQATVRFVPHSEEEGDADAGYVTLALATGRGELDGVLQKLGVIIGTALALMGLAFVALVLLLVRRGLRPLDRLANRLVAIGPGDLHQRVMENDQPAELLPIQNKLNELLARLEAAFDRERRFTRDVSHELRTPLAEIRTALEVSTRWPEDVELHKKSVRNALEATGQMQGLIATLLALATSDAPSVRVKLEPVDLAGLTNSIVEQLHDKLAARGIEVKVSGPASLVIPSDPVLLGAILRNLLDNVAAHAPAGSTANVHLADAVDGPALEIKNVAPELTPADIPNLFDPFWQKDAARSDQQHVGLGLSIVQSYSKLLGIAPTARLAADSRLVIALAFTCDSR